MVETVLRIKGALVKKYRDFAVIGNFFKSKRLDAELSQADLAKKLGFSSCQMVSNWERGLCAPPLDSIYKMLTILDLSRDEVLELILNDTRRYLEESLSRGHRRRSVG